MKPALSLLSSPLLVIALAATLGSCSGERGGESSPGALYRAEVAGGRFALEIRPEPGPIPLNEPFELSVAVTEAERPTSDVTLDVDGWMPDHGHGMLRKSEVAREGVGSYRVRGMLFHMGGEWELRVRVAWRQERGEHFTIESDEVTIPVVL